MDDAATAARLRRIVNELGQVQRRLQDSHVDNLTFRKLFHANAMARELLAELEPSEGDEQAQ